MYMSWKVTVTWISIQFHCSNTISGESDMNLAIAILESFNYMLCYSLLHLNSTKKRWCKIVYSSDIFADYFLKTIELFILVKYLLCVASLQTGTVASWQPG